MKQRSSGQELFPAPSTSSATASSQYRPLADRLRPATLDLMVGQQHLIAAGKPFRDAILSDRVGSCIFWGPPGCGKTTLARLIAESTQKAFVPFSAVLGGVKEIREIVAEAKVRLQREHQQTILFVDEVHRFNKSQQDAFLPHVEDGTLILIGATTENPSFELNGALLSRCRVIVLQPLGENDLHTLARRALGEQSVNLGEDLIAVLAQWANGDARKLLNGVEEIALHLHQNPHVLTLAQMAEILQSPVLTYDRSGDEHYNVISAFIKSMRGSDPDATLHYLARMLEAGEDPRFVARRMIIFASEDVSNADPRALQVAIAAADAFDRIGMPEGWIPLAQAATYLASVPKSNASYSGYKRAKADLAQGTLPPVPLHLRNAPTQLMKSLDYGKEYRYPHDDPGHMNNQHYLPEALKNRRYYEPSENGFESKIKAYLEHLRQLRRSET